MKFIELFAGVGGFRLGLEALGHECVFSSEIDKYARQTYEVNFGEQPSGDITKIAANDIPDHDILTGGFPCQAFSIAGRRKGFDDTRGTLFFDITRIVAVKKPRYLILENVKGLKSHDGNKTLSRIIKTLWDLGYSVDYKVLITADYEPPQKRERIFIVCQRAKSVLHRFNWPKPTVEKWGCVADIMHETHLEEVDDKYFLSDEQMAKIIWQDTAELSKRQLARVGTLGQDHHSNRIYSPKGVTRTLKGGGGGGAKTGLYQIAKLDVGYSQGARIYDSSGLNATISSRGGGVGANTGLYKVARRQRPGAKHWDRKDTILSVNSVARTLTSNHDSQCATGLYEVKEGVRRLTPRECARLQGFPDSFKLPCSDTQSYKQMGNAVSVPVITAIARGFDVQ